MINLQLANNLAKHFHSGQKYGELDYFEYHLRGVVDLLSEISTIPVSEDMITVAFLHDILEDTPCTYETLENIFGFTVADAVSILTKVDGEHIEQYLFSVCSNSTARIVKFADSLFNYKECVKCGDIKRAEKYKRNLEVLHDKQIMVGLERYFKMKYKPENVKLVITHNGVEQEVTEFDESTCIQNQPSKKIKVEVTTKSKRCKDTIDWVEVEYGDEYKKPKKGEILY